MPPRRNTLEFLFSLRDPVGPRDYLRFGLGLMLAKYLIDAIVIWLVTRLFWSPIDYLSPSIVLRKPITDHAPLLVVGLGLWTLPFLWIGASMTVRRAVDAGRSAWAGLLFFVPIVNYVLMIVLCFLPSRPPLPGEAPAAERTSEAGAPSIDRRTRSALVGLVTAVVLGLPLTIVCTLLLKSYGWSLFFGVPFVITVITGYIHNRHELRPAGETVLAATMGLALVAGSLLLFAIEGAVCIAMAFPFAVAIAWMGSLFGREFARRSRARLAPAAWLVLALPPLAAIETRVPSPDPVYEVRSSVDVAAPPAVVWRHVVSFDELPPPHELLFRLGVAYPRHATIEGTGVGAQRRCEFSTGAFEEPITVWDAPRRLSFDVTKQPDPMRELSPWGHVVPPHMTNGFRAIRGEFRLEPLPGGRTRLEGSTWYVLRLHPRGYWALWANGFVKTIHLRVLEHIRRETEAETIARADVARCAAPTPRHAQPDAGPHVPQHVARTTPPAGPPARGTND